MYRFQRLASGWIALAVLAAVAVLVPMQLQAQSFYGSIVGTVTDTSGAIIPDANVTVVNLGTNDTKQIKSDASGNFRFMSLVPANYKVEVDKDTFKRFVRQPVVVNVEATVRVDVPLEVGAATETVQVTTEAPQMETESGSLGAQVEGKRVTEMPLNGRNVMNLIALVPGVIPQGATMGTTGLNGGQGTHTNAGAWGNYQIGGGMASQSSQYYDGITINVIGNAPALIPTQDAVQEFKVQTNAVSAEFGRFSGGVVEMTTKSGTNKLHGSAYEYVRNNIFNANDWFSNLNKRPRVKWNQNQFGIQANGPVIKDKLFGMFTWEKFVSRIGSPSTSNTATAEMQNGTVYHYATDPSGLCTGITYVDAAGAPVVPNSTGSNVAKSTIPQSCWDATSKYMKALFPAPNTSAAIGSNNWYSVPTMGNDQYQYTGRADWNINQKHRFFARYSYWNAVDSSVAVYLNAGGIKSANGVTKLNVHQGVMGHTYTINPTTILDLRVGYTRFVNYAWPDAGVDVDFTKLGGNWAAVASQMSFHPYPVPSLSGWYGLNNLNPMSDTGIDYYNNYSFAASLIKIYGQHTFKVGTEERLMVDVKQGVSGMDPAGKFTFDKTLTGDEWAAFLLGEFTNGSAHTGTSRAAFVYPQSFYATDSWMVSKKLTVNAGIRWDLPSGLAERRDKATVLLPGGTTPGTDSAGNTYDVAGTLVLVKNTLTGNNKYTSRTTQNAKRNELEPRIGFAYRLTNSMAIRGGYGLVYVPPDMGGVSPNNSLVSSGSTTVSNTVASMATSPIFFANAFTVAGGARQINQPEGRANAAFMKNYINKNQTVSGSVPTEPFGYNQQWNLTVGQQLKGDMLVEVGYVGARGTHLPAGTYGINQWNWTANTLTPAQLKATAACGRNGGLTATVAQCQRAFPAYKDLQNTNHNNGSSAYHSLQTRFEKRFHNGSVIGGNFMWSKLIANTDTLGGGNDPHGTRGSAGGSGAFQDYNNPQGERSIISFAVPYRAVANYVLNLPLGKNQKFLANANPVVNAAVSGWALNGITTLMSGTPAYISVNGGNYMTQNLGAGTLRPNYNPSGQQTYTINGVSTVYQCNGNKNVSGSRFERATSKPWFNVGCFGVPGKDPVTGAAQANDGFVLGNQARVDGAIRAQGTINFDFTVVKTTTIHDNINLQFRSEFFNIFNHPQFAPPSWMMNNQIGQTLMQLNTQRLIQFSARVNF